MKEPARTTRNMVAEIVKAHPASSSKQIHERLSRKIGYATLKRILQGLIRENLITTTGKGRGTRYVISPAYDLIWPIDVEEYFTHEIDERNIRERFNHALIREVLPQAVLFNEEEEIRLNNLQKKYVHNLAQLSPLEKKKELERLAIDLSWKSSQIEGNTYTLLETERLLKENKTASGKTKDEAMMLLNHKEAIDFILQDLHYGYPLTIAKIEDIHSLLMKELNVDRNLRRRSVGISGTNYRPLDNEFQIREALELICMLINSTKGVFSKALLALLLISYLQPFVDGNKRTARIIGNAVLIHHNHCPLSFRTVDSIDYKKAMLLFYEQNNLYAFKKIFMDQFEFAVNTYFG